MAPYAIHTINIHIYKFKKLGESMVLKIIRYVSALDAKGGKMLIVQYFEHYITILNGLVQVIILAG